MEYPRYIHDCERCTFLGACEVQNATEAITFDLYACPGHCRVSLVARYGDAAPEYLSGQAFGTQVYGPLPVQEAFRRYRAHLKIDG